MRSHEERLDETTFEKTARPVLDEIPKTPQISERRRSEHQGPRRRTRVRGVGKIGLARSLSRGLSSMDVKQVTTIDGRHESLGQRRPREPPKEH